jgi:RNA polymerase primary sigma factor
MSREEEREHFRLYKDEGSEEARDAIVECNLRFVIRVAQQFRGRGLILEDLVQEGTLGLLEAIDKFDHRLGFRFSTYAAFWIRQAIQVAVRQRGSLIRIPVRKSRMLGFLGEFVQECRSTKGRAPTEGEVAERLSITKEKARELARLSETVLSLDAPVDDEGSLLLDLIPDRHSPSPDREARDNELTAKLSAALSLLSERETSVILQRYGMEEGTRRSLRGISRRMGLSQEGVRRIEQRAMGKLRRPHVSRTLVGLI